MEAITIQDLRKRYGNGSKQVEALRGVSLHVQCGEIYGLLGRNGAGKTTLVKVLLDLVRPTTGSARILGVEAGRVAARRPVGYLPEDHRFPEYQTGESALWFYGQLSGLPAAVLRTRTPELLHLVGLKDAGKRRIRAYSKGMKQRLGLAQALLHEPQVLLLDEPTDGVDPVGRAEIREVLTGLKQRGKTVFLNSHLLSEVERLCDRVAILERGELVREGTIDALTRGQNVVRITTVPVLDTVTQAVLAQQAVSVQRRDDGFEIGIRRDEDVDGIVDLLRSRGYSLRGLTQKRATLEDVFLEALQEKPR